MIGLYMYMFIYMNKQVYFEIYLFKFMLNIIYIYSKDIFIFEYLQKRKILNILNLYK